MSGTTKIEWADVVWNPTTGCDRVSPGCDHCYALTLAKRLKGMGAAKYQTDGDPKTSGPGFAPTMHWDSIGEPLRWRKPRKVFVNSMSDLFHDAISDEFIARVWAVMALTPQHTYQVLTKRHGRMRPFLRDECRCGSGHAPSVHLRSQMAWAVSKANPNRIPGVPDDAEHRVYFQTPWPLPNAWLGVSVEDQQRALLRIDKLRQTPAAVRFLSCEPLLGPLDLDLDGIDWVIVGGESGPGARPMHPDWARSLRDQCAATGVAFHFKQWGVWAPVEPDVWRHRTESDWLVRHDGYAWPLAEPHGEADGTEVTVRRFGKYRAGRQLDGRTHDEFPRAAVGTIEGAAS